MDWGRGGRGIPTTMDIANLFCRVSKTPQREDGKLTRVPGGGVLLGFDEIGASPTKNGLSFDAPTRLSNRRSSARPQAEPKVLGF